MPRRRNTGRERSRTAQETSRQRLVRLALGGMTALLLVFSLLAGGDILFGTSPAISSETAHYQAYQMTDPALQRFFQSARRLDDTLILVASQRWNSLESKEKSALMSRVSSSLTNWDGIRKINVLDGLGHSLARARGSSIQVEAGSTALKRKHSMSRNRKLKGRLSRGSESHGDPGLP